MIPSGKGALVPGSRSFERSSLGPATHVSNHSFSAALVKLSVSSMHSEEGSALLQSTEFSMTTTLG